MIVRRLVLLCILVCLVTYTGYARAPISDVRIIQEMDWGEGTLTATMVPPIQVNAPPSNVSQFWTTDQPNTTGDWPEVTDFGPGDPLGYCVGYLIVPRDQSGAASASVVNYLNFNGQTFHVKRFDLQSSINVYCPSEYEYVTWYLQYTQYVPSGVSRLRQSHAFTWEMALTSPFGNGTGGGSFSLHPN